MTRCLFLGLLLSAIGLGAESVWGESTAGEYSDQSLNEIVVTAQKREERLLDVPVPVTSIKTQVLVDQGQIRLADYYTSIPGLTLQPDPQGSSDMGITIRGLNSGGGNPTVAILLNGMPVGSSSGLAAAEIPDIDPGELERIEVLRGPQGTLYGAGGIGGVLNLITAAPSTDAFSGRVQTDVGTVYSGNGPNYGVRGAINVPISETWAVRASAYTRHDAGYVDNILIGQSGINWADAAGGHLAALWKPSSTLSLELGALVDDYTLHGSPAVNIAPGFSDLQQSDLRGTGGNHRSVRDFSAILKAAVGSFEITSLSSYNVDFRRYLFDYSVLTCCTQAFGDLPGGLEDTRRAVNVNEEIRLETRINEKLDWLMGGYYTHQSGSVNQDDPLIDPASGTTTGVNVFNTDWWSTYQEVAVFGDLTVKFTDQFDVQFGGRESFNKQHFQETDSGPLLSPFESLPPTQTVAVYPSESTSQSVFTYLVTPRFRLNDHFMAYARLASGYRPGNLNANDAGSNANLVPPAVGADRTKNYEIGFKGDAFDRKLTFDTSAYYIDWKNIQLNLIAPCGCLGYGGNGAGAKSEGVELSLEFRPVGGLSVDSWVAFNRAELTQQIPVTVVDGVPLRAAYGEPGDLLPGSARFSTYTSVQQEFALASHITGFVGGGVSYIGQQLGTFMHNAPVGPDATPRQVYSGYAKTDLHAGVIYSEWKFNLYANNIADRRAKIGGGAGNVYPDQFILISPRAIGLSVARTF